MPKKIVNNMENVNNNEIDMDLEIAKDEEAEKEYKTVEPDYYVDSTKVYTGEEEKFHSLGEFEKYGTEDELTTSSTFIKALGLEDGVLNVKVPVSKFNSAFHKAMEPAFKSKGTKYIANKDYITNKEKTVYTIGFDNLSKASIIEYAKAKRSECFSFLLGENPNQANPNFVDKCYVKNEDGTIHTELAYNYGTVGALVKSFESDEDLYKSAITHINFNHFNKAWKEMELPLVEKGGKEVPVFGGEEDGASNAYKYVSAYLNLRDIHKARPWYYRFINPRWNFTEHIVLDDYKDYIMQAAKNSRVEDLVNNCLNARNDNDRMKAMETLCHKLNPNLDAKKNTLVNENEAIKEKKAIVVEEVMEKEPIVEFDLSNKNTTPVKTNDLNQLSDEEEKIPFAGMTEKEY